MLRQSFLFFVLSRIAFSQIVLTDDLGRRVTLSAPAQRIVSLAPSITESLFALGAGGQVVGITDFCNYPREVSTIPRVGGIVNPSIETVVNLHPDLIALSMEGNVRDDFARLEGLGVPVFVSNPRTLSGIHKSLTDLGVLTGRKDTATRVVRAMQRSEDSIKALVLDRRSVLMIVSVQPLIVVGGGTFLSELLGLAGGNNVAGASASTYPTLSREAVVVADPDMIILLSDLVKDPSELVSLFPEWKGIRAMRNHCMFQIDADIISRPGPRATEGLAALYAIIHEGHE
jgi:iron complex transport system substrate-binding protein